MGFSPSAIPNWTKCYSLKSRLDEIPYKHYMHYVVVSGMASMTYYSQLFLITTPLLGLAPSLAMGTRLWRPRTPGRVMVGG